MKKLLFLSLAMLAGANMLNAAANDKAEKLEKLQKLRATIQDSIEFEEFISEARTPEDDEFIQDVRERLASQREFLSEIDQEIERLSKE